MKIFFQSRFCPLCSQIHTEKTLCLSCQALLLHTETLCSVCGISLTESKICGQCLNKNPPYRQIVPCYWYKEPLQTLIHDYKFREKLFLTPILGKLMQEKINYHYKLNSINLPECLIPVPIHPKRLKERGYHHVYELAKIVSRHLSIPVTLKMCQRIEYSTPQSRLAFALRKKNVQHAFSAKKMDYNHVAVIDDVVTTGETIRAVCQTLKKANPNLLIDVWCLAKTTS